MMFYLPNLTSVMMQNNIFSNVISFRLSA